jgi:sugar/nucleoside kinase (ribokinase family)
MKRFDVACVGISCADVLARPVDGLPERGKLGLVDTLVMRMGGCASNAAIGLAKIGMRAAYVGTLGADGFGEFILDTFASEKVDVSGVRRDPAVPTSASVVLIGSDGERSILHCIGSNGRFSFEDVDMDIVSDSKLLLVAGTFLMPGFDGEGTLKLLTAARERGVTTCLDTAWDATGAWLAKLGQALPLIGWFMPSYEEARAMSGGISDPATIAEFFIGKGVGNAIVKLGKDGCWVRPSGQPGFRVPTFDRVKAVDASGAGDAFCAGFLTGLALDWDVARCARFANAVGTHCVMKVGTTDGIRPMAEILKFMEGYGD